MEYPEEIYDTRDGGMHTDHFKNTGAGWGRRHAYKVGYEAGKAEQADPLSDYSNLTAAIQAGEPIDWERLDGKKIQLVNPEMGTLHWTLKRDKRCAPDSFYGWWDGETDSVYVRALCPAWSGSYGWSLWVEGEIPLARKTSDQLEVGTYFLGELGGRSIDFMYVGRPIDTDKEKTIYYAPDMLKSITPASEWVVLEEYGPFQKPEDK